MATQTCIAFASHVATMHSMRCQLSTVERKSDGTGSTSAILTRLTHTDKKSFETCQASTKLASFIAGVMCCTIVSKTPHDFTHIPNVRFVVRLATLCNAILLLNVRYVRLRPLPGKKSSREAEVRFPPPPDRASERAILLRLCIPSRSRSHTHSSSVGRSALVKFLWKCATPLLSLSPLSVSLSPL